MHILIIETALTGHHSGYLERIAGAYLDMGHSVTALILQRDSEHPTIARLQAKFPVGFNLILLEDARYEAALYSWMGEIGRELALRHIFGKMYRIVNKINPVDYVFLPYLDYCLYALGLLGSPFGTTQWGGICMRPSFHYGHYGVIAPKPKLCNVKRAIFLKLLRSKTLKSVYTIDELLHRFVAERHSRWVHRLQYVPDPAELKGKHTYESSRRTLGVPSGAVLVLVYGAIDERKGLDVLLDAVSSDDVPKALHVLVAGRQSAAIQPLMNSSQVNALAQEGRCHVINSFVDDALEQMVFAAADIVWLGYRNHYSMSGVLILAAIAGLPVIATKDGLIGWYTKKLSLGSIVDVHESIQITSALNLRIEKISSHLTCYQNGIKSQHGWSNFIKTLDINRV